MVNVTVFQFKYNKYVAVCRFLHPVARMDPHTIQEIRGYNRPAPVVHNVMRCTYTLLGEKQDLDVGSVVFRVFQI